MKSITPTRHDERNTPKWAPRIRSAAARRTILESQDGSASGGGNPEGVRPKVTANAVKADILATLARRARVAAGMISVSVRGDEVTLTGTVHSCAELDLAGSSAACMPGVNSVINHIKVSY